MKPLDRESLEVGSRIWAHTYGQGMSDDGAWDVIRDRHTWNHQASDWDNEQLMERLLCWATWAHAGFPMIEVEEKYAAALMASHGTRDVSSDVVVPWQSFLVRVPRDLLVDGAVCFDRIWFGRIPGVSAVESNPAWGVCMRMLDTESGVEQPTLSTDLAGLLLGERPVRASNGISDARWRCVNLARKLTVGALYSLQYTTNFRWHDRKLKKHIVGRNGPPTHRVAVIGRPISVDCRPWVREYVATGEGRSPAVQSLVRGHFKRQVIGISRSGRKVIWVEPYWRGPEDAPILARPLKVTK